MQELFDRHLKILTTMSLALALLTIISIVEFCQMQIEQSIVGLWTGPVIGNIYLGADGNARWQSCDRWRLDGRDLVLYSGNSDDLETRFKFRGFKNDLLVLEIGERETVGFTRVGEQLKRLFDSLAGMWESETGEEVIEIARTGNAIRYFVSHLDHVIEQRLHLNERMEMDESRRFWHSWLIKFDIAADTLILVDSFTGEEMFYFRAKENRVRKMIAAAGAVG